MKKRIRWEFCPQGQDRTLTLTNRRKAPLKTILLVDRKGQVFTAAGVAERGETVARIDAD